MTAQAKQCREFALSQFLHTEASLQTSKRERKHRQDIIWTLRAMPAPEWVVENWPGSAAVIAVHSQGKSIDEVHYYVCSLRIGAQALLRHVRDRWSIENSWHWPSDTQLKQDAHRYRETNDVQIMTTLRSDPLSESPAC